MKSSLRFLTFGFVLLATCLPRSARAEESANAALAKFDEGVSLFNGGKFQAAAETFREAYNMRPSWKLLFNIGQSEAAAKRYGLALEAFEQFLAEGGDEITEDRRDEVLAEVVRLRKMVGYLKIEAAHDTAIFIDDLKRGTAPMNNLLPISAGINHTVRGELNNEVVFSDSYKVFGSQTMEVDMTNTDARPAETTVEPVVNDESVEPEPVGTEAGVPSDVSPKHPLLVAGWAVGGTGAAAAIAGGIVGGIALSKNNDLASQCKDTSCPDRTGDESKYHSMANASTALLAAGGTVFAVGAVMLIVGAIQKKRKAPPVALGIFTDGRIASASFALEF